MGRITVLGSAYVKKVYFFIYNKSFCAQAWGTILKFDPSEYPTLSEAPANAHVVTFYTEWVDEEVREILKEKGKNLNQQEQSALKNRELYLKKTVSELNKLMNDSHYNLSDEDKRSIIDASDLASAMSPKPGRG